jgi:N-acetylglucosaminyl-diphospho-decaprenol L-rhamnosyltransferase
VSDQARFRVAILIVGFRNPQDIDACLNALSLATTEPCFDIFICENGGSDSFQELYKALVSPAGPCIAVSDDLPASLACPSSQLPEVKCLALKRRSARVWIGCAVQNLGYAGGINVWIKRLLPIPGWEGIWILNPDSEPEPGALDALVRRASASHKGMVGSTILPFEDRDHVHCRAGHRFTMLMTRLSTIGFREPVNRPVDVDSIESALDCISGASMYVTRACLEKIGPMDERFFLYYEDADWSIRAKNYGLGYARDSIVPHRGGTTIGSAARRSKRSRLSVYLESRNRIHFARLHTRRFFLLAAFLDFLYALEYLLAGSPRNFKAALDGLVAGLKGETGRPSTFDDKRSTASDSKKKVLIISTRPWPPAARVAAALVRLGLQTAAISPSGAMIRRIKGIRPRYHYLRWRGVNSIAGAIKAWRPDLLICADDQAVCDVHDLHQRAARVHGPEGGALRDLIETSLGDPAAFPIARAKSSLILYAQSQKVRCPRTVVVDNQNREAAIRSASYPLMVKLDGSWGGMGVKLAYNENEARTAIRQLAGPAASSRLGRESRWLRKPIEPAAKPISLQQYIAGRPANRAVACHKGKVLAGISVEVLESVREFGPASVIRIIDHAEMAAAAAVLVERLCLSGLIGFDFVLDSTNQAWLLEMNPRLTPTCYLFMKGGVGAGPDWRTALSADDIFATSHEMGATIALFPQELQRSRQSEYLPQRTCHHDIPWDELEFVRACLNSIVAPSFLQWLRNRLR